jgi:hypothetical protein
VVEQYWLGRETPAEQALAIGGPIEPILAARRRVERRARVLRAKLAREGHEAPARATAEAQESE